MKKIKQKFYALIFWRTPIGEILNKIYDLKIHFKYSFKLKKNTEKEKLASYLQKQFHVIEKGLALPSPRPGFGKDKILDIIANAKKYLDLYGNDTLITSLIATLKEYIDFNKRHKEDITNDYYRTIIEFTKEFEAPDNAGGTKKVLKKDILKAIDIDFEKFIKSRNSVRDFAAENVKTQEVLDAVSLAKYAPSVCNRQGWHVHLYKNKAQIKELLSLQNGNRGFTDSINQLLIITGDTYSFTKYESNQIFIDGGLFAMNLILALHAKGIGSIALNTDIPYIIEKKMKKTGNIPEHERLIMYLGIGKLKDEYKVAVSKRKETDKIISVHE
jgi:nitroreductase